MISSGIHHVSINVKDVDSAVAFYVGLLELEQLDRPDLGFPGAWLKSGDQEVHLLDIESDAPPKEQHFAFRVEDLDKVIEHLEQRNIKVSQPNEITGVCRQALAHDPSGNMVEFNQRL